MNNLFNYMNRHIPFVLTMIIIFVTIIICFLILWTIQFYKNKNLEIYSFKEKYNLFQNKNNDIVPYKLNDFYLNKLSKINSNFILNKFNNEIKNDFIIFKFIINNNEIVINYLIFNNKNYINEKIILEKNFESNNNQLTIDSQKTLEQLYKKIYNSIIIIDDKNFLFINNLLINNLNININNLIRINYELLIKNFNKKEYKNYNKNFLVEEKAMLIINILLTFNNINIKNNTKNTTFEEIRNHNLILQNKNEPSFGIYNNFFGSKQSLNLRKLIYIEEKIDSCDLCIPFENQILSLDEFDPKYLTIYEAMSKGFNHLGCNHSKIDYLPNNTIIPKKQFSVSLQKKKNNLKKEQYKYEQNIRNLKYDLDNGINQDQINKFLIELELIEEKYKIFLGDNQLSRNLNREDYKKSDIILFS